MDRAAPSGQLRAWPNCSSMKLPIIMLLPPPSTRGDDVGAERRDEDEDAARDDARAG